MSSSGPPDSELLAHWLANRREAAFHSLVDRYSGLVHSAAKRVCDDGALAADAAQLTFITLAIKANSLTSRSSLAGWLHVTAVMQAKNLLRHHQREIRKLQLLHTHMETPPPDSPADAWKRLQPVLDNAIAALSANDREAILLRFYRSLSVPEIANKLGIATATAHKRLDRALVRLRHQISRRGGEVEGSLGITLAAGFSADALTLLPAVRLIAAKATAAATGTSAIFTLGILMTTKTTTTVAASILLLAGAGAYFLLTTGHDAAGDNRHQASQPSTHSSPSRLAPDEEAPALGTTRPHTREAPKNPDLVAQYGESRTNLSRQITGNIISLLDDVVEIGELSLNGGGVTFGDGWHTGLKGVGRALKLTPEQEEKVAALYSGFQTRQLDLAKASTAGMKEDPAKVMRLLLANDAFSRAEITASEYAALQNTSRDDQQGIVGALGKLNLGGSPVLDDIYRAQFRALLDPSQAGIFQAAMEETDAKALAAQAQETEITKVMAMNLQQLDQYVDSSRKMAGGFKTMLEGIGTIRANNTPLPAH
ncbi:MAG: sigma-70 family RNA polymerase sigma factor [Luteolibacter sp.]|uniref:sigma-70 family RNA polymerase sigma factor n=1 Tax=Luteolibacter sp. TaxID=1962973 RepID=UPI0032673C80